MVTELISVGQQQVETLNEMREVKRRATVAKIELDLAARRVSEANEAAESARADKEAAFRNMKGKQGSSGMIPYEKSIPPQRNPNEGYSDYPVELGKFDSPLWHAPYGCIV